MEIDLWANMKLVHSPFGPLPFLSCYFKRRRSTVSSCKNARRQQRSSPKRYPSPRRHHVADCDLAQQHRISQRGSDPHAESGERSLAGRPRAGEKSESHLPRQQLLQHIVKLPDELTIKRLKITVLKGKLRCWSKKTSIRSQTCPRCARNNRPRPF